MIAQAPPLLTASKSVAARRSGSSGSEGREILVERRRGKTCLSSAEPRTPEEK
jgi:hypothetical protein